MTSRGEAARDMTVWAEGSGSYTDETRFRTITAREFVRRFRHAVTRQETSFVWLMGAGCSVSSGIPTADEAVRSWLKDLKYLETGQEADLEGWACKRFVGYDPDRPGRVYGEVLEALFYTEQDRRRELERMMKVAEPGFGYATLAQLMTHEKWGGRCSVAVSTNFDDLAADALHLYSQRRPQVFTHESLNRRTPISPNAPTVVKIFGDAHLPRGEGGSNRPQLNPEVLERLREQMTETGLIIVGYGGRDESVLDMLEGLPSGAPAGGVFWVNNQPPLGPIGDWLERRSGIWVSQGDFDELMYYVRLEFGLGHPKIERFERILRKYEAQYRELSTRAGLGLPETPAENGATTVGGFGLNAPATLAARRETESSRRERMQKSFDAFAKVKVGAAARSTPPSEPPSDGDAETTDAAAAPGARRPNAAPGPDNVDALFAAAARELQRGRGKRSAPAEAEAETDFAPESGDGPLAGMNVDAVLAQIEKGPEEGHSAMDDSGAAEAETHAADAAEGEVAAPTLAAEEPNEEAPLDDAPLDHAPHVEAPAVEAPRREVAPSEPSAASTDPVEAPSDGDAIDDAAIDDFAPFEANDEQFSTARGASPVAAPQETAEAAYEKVASERGAAIRAARRVEANQLPDEPITAVPSDVARAGEAAFMAAIEDLPSDASLRLRFARFLAVGARDAGRAEQAFEAAIDLAPESVEALRDYARFAIEQLQDAPRAERLLTKALNLDLRNADTLRALASFLLRARGDLDEAENCFRLAIEVAPDAAENLIAYARFLEERRGRREAAEAYLRRAAESESANARALAELAVFRAAQANNFDSAEKMLQRAVQLDAEDAAVFYARAMLAERKGDLDAAEEAFEGALSRNPTDVRAHLSFARFLRHRRCDLEAADAQHRRAAAAAPDLAEPLSAYAMFLEDVRNDSGEAERRHRDAIELEPYNPLVLSAFAEHLGRRREMLEEADALFRDALRLSPRSGQILRAYGRFLDRSKGDADTAETYFRRAVEMDPHSVEALDDLAQFLHSVRDDAEEAEVYFREALRLAPDRADTLHRFAAFLRDSRRDPDEAESCYRRALERNPKDAATLSRAAQFLLAEGRRSEGLKLLNDAFDAAWSMDPSVRPSWLMLELWIYRYAHDPARREESLKAARGLIQSGARSDGWDLGPTVDQAVSANHPKPDLLRDLAAVATDGAEMDVLERHFE